MDLGHHVIGWVHNLTARAFCILPVVTDVEIQSIYFLQWYSGEIPSGKSKM